MDRAMGWVESWVRPVRRHVRVAGLAIAALGNPGCVPFAEVTSGHIGCAPHDIKISDEDVTGEHPDLDGRVQWTTLLLLRDGP